MRINTSGRGTESEGNTPTTVKGGRNNRSESKEARADEVSQNAERKHAKRPVNSEKRRNKREERRDDEGLCEYAVDRQWLGSDDLRSS